MSEPLWLSWSAAGRVQAAKAIGSPVHGVLPTTNHLESFNRVLKQGHIRRLEKSGKRLRFDVFFHFLISRIIPAVFDARRHESNYSEWKSRRFQDQIQLSPTIKSPEPATHPIAWSPTSPSDAVLSRRRAEGSDIARFGRVLNVRWADLETYQAECLSSRFFLPTDPGAVLYAL